MVSMALTLVDPTTAVQQAKGYMDIVTHLRTNLLRSGVDYGVIPGTGKVKVKLPDGKEVEREKEVLLKPGAERLCSAFGFAPVFKLINKVELWDTDKPLFHYQYCCELIHIDSGKLIATGIGSCNSMEDKYRWRNAQRTCPNCGKENIRKSKEAGAGWYCWQKTGGCGATFKENDPAITGQSAGKVANDDVFSLVNTIDKMAQKRALIAATLIGCNASEFFTQDLDDMPNFGTVRGDVIEAEIVEETPSKPTNNNSQKSEPPADQPPESSAFSHWYDDPGKRATVLSLLSKKYTVTESEAAKLVGKPLREFASGKEAALAVEAALNKAATPKNGTGKLHWADDPAQMETLAKHLLDGFELTPADTLKRLGKASWKDYLNLDAAKADILETATEQNWDMIATTANYYEYGSPNDDNKKRIIRFNTPRLVVWYKGRKALIKAMDETAKTLWIEVEGWQPQTGDLTKIEPLPLPEKVRITAKPGKSGALEVARIVAAEAIPF